MSKHMNAKVISRAGSTGYTGKHERTCEIEPFDYTNGKCGRMATVSIERKWEGVRPAPFLACRMHANEFEDDMYEITKL